MRKSAKSSRAPLAPLHNNSLRCESPRKTAKGDGKQDVKGFGHKASNQLHTATKVDKANADFPNRAHDAGRKAAKTQSPAKARKSVQLVTTSAVPARSGTLGRIKQGLKKPAEAPSAKQATASLLVRPRAAQQSAAPLSAVSSGLAPPTVDQAGAGALAAAALQADASTPSSVLHQWHVPATPPSISALPGPSETTAAGNAPRDVQNSVTHATLQSGVKGVGTPQDFSDVFDLDEVSCDMLYFAACTIGLLSLC